MAHRRIKHLAKGQQKASISKDYWCESNQRCVSKQVHWNHTSFHPRPSRYFPLDEADDGSVMEEYCTVVALNALQTGLYGTLANLKVDYPPNTGDDEILPIANALDCTGA